MGTIDEINKFRRQGRTDEEIVNVLKARGISDDEVQSAFSQAQIKEAVSSGGLNETNFPSDQPLTDYNPDRTVLEPPVEQSYSIGTPLQDSSTYEYPQGYPDNNAYASVPNNEMQPSIVEQGEMQENVSNAGYPDAQAGYANNAYASDAYQQYQPYQEVMSSDIISEVAEQVVSEKMSLLQDRLEKALDFKNIAETKIVNLDERLRRIEQIIDRLQLSLLQRVGEYVNDVKDLKIELGETQKSFKALNSAPHHRVHHFHKHKGKKVP